MTAGRLIFLIRRILEIAIVAYLVIFFATLLTRGAGFSLEILGFELKATSTVKYALIVIGLVFARTLLALRPRRAILVVGSLCFSLLLVEIGLRLLDPPMARTPELQRWMKPHPTMGHELIPDVRGIGSYGYQISINSHGQRDVERPLSKPRGTRRILGVGDSFTFGVGVELSETFLKILEADLRHDGVEVEVINSGVIGWGLDQISAYLEERGLGFEPDLVLYALYWNDIPLEPPPDLDFSETAITRRRTARQVASPPFEEPRKSPSYVYNLLRNGVAYASSHFRFLQGADWLRDLETRRAEFVRINPDTGAIEHFGRRLQGMQEFVRARAGVPLLVVLVPDAAQIGVPELQRINRVLETECASLGVPFIDATPAFEASEDPLALYLLPVDAHASAAGNRLIAEEIKRSLRTVEWLRVQ